MGNYVWTKQQIHDELDRLYEKHGMVGVSMAVEFRDGGYGYAVMDRVLKDDLSGWEFVGVWGATDRSEWLREKDYGVSWRVWDEEPTKEDMENTLWDDQSFAVTKKGVNIRTEGAFHVDEPKTMQRPMTLEEAKEWSDDECEMEDAIGVWAWVEERPESGVGREDGMLFRAVLDEDFSLWHGRQRGLTAIWGAYGINALRDDEVGECFFEERDYGKLWRVWKEKPTKAEMAAAPWEPLWDEEEEDPDFELDPIPEDLYLAKEKLTRAGYIVIRNR